jgi:HlyD family secretion protein
VSSEAPRSPTVRELESLRIARTEPPPHKRRIGPALIALAAIAVIAVGGYEVYVNTYGRPQQVETAYVIVRRSGQPGVILTGSGYVVTKQKYITVGAQVLGQIVAEPIEEGQHVKKGDVLARIDGRDYVAQLNQAIANHNLAVANVELKRAQAKRIRALYAAHVESRDSLDVANNALNVAEASVKHAEAAIAFARFNVSQCVIRSPVNGIVLKKYREIGSMINYGGDIEAGGGTTDIAQLADTDDMRAEVDINESDIAKVRMGAPATVTLDSYQDRSFAAKVVKIYPAADRQKGTVKVEVHLIKPDLRIVKPEMSAKITFLAGETAKQEAQPLILVPRKAVVGQGAGASVWVVREGIARRVPIALGREFQDGTEVKRGLDGGEMVIVTPPPNLHNGERVTALRS